MSQIAHDPLMDIAYRPVRLGSVAAHVDQRVDGSTVIELVEPLGPYPVRLTERLLHWAEQEPNWPFLARRPISGEGWETLSYRQTLDSVRAIGQALLDRGLSPERPVMILSDRSFEHALIALAALHVGVPYIPVTPAYALLATDFSKLRYVADLCSPGLIFADDGAPFARAMQEVFSDIECVVTTNPLTHRASTSFAALLATVPTPEVDAAFAAVGADTLGKIMFTSGTTGAPKGVMYSQRMLCSNRQQFSQALAFLSDTRPVLVDWLPWHHTFGGTNNFGLVLYDGGTYYFDPGKPLPDQVGPTVQALREIAPTMYLNTPQGFSALLPYLRSDAQLRKNFFSRLSLIYYGGASLPTHIWTALDELAVEATGQRVLIVSGLGCTEVGPCPSTTNWDPRRQALAGLPVAGMKIKVVPVGTKLEIRYSGPCVTPGYWKNSEGTLASFDEEGYFRSGDAVRFIDPDQPQRGLRFDGRIAENFKLLSGTWVNTAEVRERALAMFAPYANDVVIAGHDREFICALVFPDMKACRQLAGNMPDSASALQIVSAPMVRTFFQAALDGWTQRDGGSSSRIARIVLESEMPTLDSGELSAKSAISPVNVLTRRAAVVTELYQQPTAERVLVAAVRSKA